MLRNMHLFAQWIREHYKKPEKATDWSGIKNGNSSKETGLSWYPSIDEKHIWVYVKFDGRLSIPFREKKEVPNKKVGLFPRFVPF
jgi:hypothetical protein